MKKFVALCLMTLMFFNVFGQRIKIDTITNVSSEFSAQPKDGIQNFKKYIAKEFQISKEMNEKQLNGKIICSFIVQRDGSFSDIEVLKDLGYGTAKGAIRILQKYTSNFKWIPRIIGGRYVKEFIQIEIVLDLEDD